METSALDRKTDLIVTLKVSLGECWSAEIEFSDSSTLDDVHFAIQQAVEFDNDHLYAFFVARTQHSRHEVMYDDQEETGDVETRIRDVFPLERKRHLFYLFDWGDSWVFKVAKTRKKPREPVDGVDYPRVVAETGQKPIQYNFDF